MIYKKTITSFALSTILLTVFSIASLDCALFIQENPYPKQKDKDRKTTCSCTPETSGKPPRFSKQTCPEIQVNQDSSQKDNVFDFLVHVSNGYVTYYEAKRIPKEKIPCLYPLLADRNYACSWGNVATLIAFLGEGDEAVNAMLDYIQRSDPLDLVPERNRDELIAGKIRAVSGVGFLKGEKVDDFLKEMLTPKGATSCVSSWGYNILPRMWQDQREYMSIMLRGKAAQGLVYTQKKDNIRIVKTLYDTTLAELSSDLKERQKIFPEAKVTRKDLNQVEVALLSQLVDAMAIRDFIKKNGLQAYYEIHNSEREGHYLHPYLRKHDKQLK